MVTLEMLIILLKEIVMHTVENKRYSYLNDRHLAMIEVYTVGDSLASCNLKVAIFRRREGTVVNTSVYASSFLSNGTFLALSGL